MPVGYRPCSHVPGEAAGAFRHVGLGEDTWGLNEHVLGDDHFSSNARLRREREAMFFDGWIRCSAAWCVCVFDGRDRMQHMFWRYHDAEHPAGRRKCPPSIAPRLKTCIVAWTTWSARTMAKCIGQGHAADGQFRPRLQHFPPGDRLQSLVGRDDYLKVDEQPAADEHLAGVDWSQTRAFATA